MQELTKIDGIKYLAISVPDNLQEASVSLTGKSLSYRVLGEYLKSNGECGGAAGKISPYLRKKFNYDINPVKYQFNKSELCKYVFNDLIMTAILIRIN